MKKEPTYANPNPTIVGPRTVAVIDIGASSLRMQIAEINTETGAIRNLESYTQAVSVGKDSFIKGHIEKSTIEDCVRVLQIYRAKLDEYQITDPNDIRVIATSGVREASNRVAFDDRIFVATGFEIEPFDEAELHRVTYLGILPFIEKQSQHFSGKSIIFEAGGGTSELLLLDRSDVLFSRTYRLGSLRLRRTIEQYDAPLTKSRSLMENQILQKIDEFKASVPLAAPEKFIAMGGDVRFAANEINQKPVGEELVEVKLRALGKFTDEILSQSPDHLATRYHMSLPDAKSLGPGLLTQLMFANQLGIKKFLVANVNLRDGLIKEMAQGQRWSDAIQTQIVQSAIRLGRKYQFNEPHAVHVAAISCLLFDQLKWLHKLPTRFRGILQLAALLHEIGAYVSHRSLHKHSMYLIRNSDLFGLGKRDLLTVALIERYHRRASPQPSHEGYVELRRESRVAITKLAALLRIAKALDDSRSQRIGELECSIEPTQVVIGVPRMDDVSLEQLALRQSRSLFEEIFGKPLVLRRIRAVVAFSRT